jgi:hypothetical protein
MRFLLLLILISCVPKHIEIDDPSQFSDYPDLEIDFEELEGLPEAGDGESEEEKDEEER